MGGSDERLLPWRAFPDIIANYLPKPLPTLYPRDGIGHCRKDGRVEDRVISGTDNRQEPGLLAGEARSRPQPGVANAFPSLLERLREERGLSKAELAKRTGLDPSTITRFEQGARMPERETILMLANAMVVPMSDRDRLLAAAGFRSELWDDPVLVELAQLLNEPDIAARAREEARGVLRMAIAYLKMQRLQDY